MGSADSICVVTGANSGIGRATAIHLATAGHTVYGTVRSIANSNKLLAMAHEADVTIELVELDVADTDSVVRGFDLILAKAARVDVLVNNAGIGGNGVVEETPIEAFSEVMNVNFYGALRCIKQVLPGMRQRQRGVVVNISSVVGRFAAQAQAPYVASKWALEAASEELAQEVAMFGVRVAIIEPGTTRTAIFAKNTDSTRPGSPYEPHLRRMFQFYALGHDRASDPFEVARTVEEAVSTSRPQLRYPIGWGASEIIDGRRRMTDEEWIGLGLHLDDDEYHRAFSQFFGIESAAPADRD